MAELSSFKRVLLIGILVGIIEIVEAVQISLQ
jgi:hypothetical protein